MRRQELPQTDTAPETSDDIPQIGPHLARVLRADQGVLTAAVLLPNTPDLKGTAYTPETVKMAMDGYTAKPKIGVEHKGKPLANGVTHLSSWQTTEDQDFDGNQLPAGTWMMMVLVTDPDLWTKVENGEINGLSIQGSALVNDADLPSLAAQEVARILMEEAAKHQFSSTQVDLPYPLVDRVKEFGRSLIPDEDLHDEGREHDPHVTVRYGLHDSHPTKVRGVLEGEPAVEGELGRTAIFETPDYDVVHLQVHSPDLHRLNRKLSVLPHTDTRPSYHPHVTLAFVKKGMGQKYADRADLEGTPFRGSMVTFSGRTGDRDWISLRDPAARYPELSAFSY